MKKLYLGTAAILLIAVSGQAQQQPQPAQQNDMGFFVTSGVGRSADTGGLAGADQLCQSLARRRVPARRPGTPIFRRKARAR